MADDDAVKGLIDKLSRSQMQALRGALEQREISPDVSPDKLSDDEIRELKIEAQRFQQAQRQITDALGVLWNAQLDVAIRSGNPDSIRRNMMRPDEVAFYDNCSCGGGGTGGSCW